MPNPATPTTIQEFLFKPEVHRFPWHMGWSDRLGMIHVLQNLRPTVSLEVGTFDGGSLEVITRFSGRTCSIDIDPTVVTRLKPHFSEVEFITGDSAALIGPTLDSIEQRGEELQFVLIDGDHSEAAAKRDIECVLAYRPRSRMCILIHDSFNPAVRRAILSANWSENPHVHLVDVDFTTGAVLEDRGKVEMWGGLALAVLSPVERIGPVNLQEESGLQFKTTVRGMAKSKWWPFR